MNALKNNPIFLHPWYFNEIVLNAVPFGSDAVMKSSGFSMFF